MNRFGYSLGLSLLAAILGGCAAPSIPTGFILRSDTPDPGVVHHGGEWIVASTSGCMKAGAIRMHRSKDLMEWEELDPALSRDHWPAWIGGCDFWAPEIHRVGDRWILLYSARDHERRFHIGLATASTPEGPFIDIGKPFVSDPRTGAIDASWFHDSRIDKHYVIWKVDSNDLRPMEPTCLYAREVNPDTLTPVGEPIPLFANDTPWEGHVVEAPSLLRRNGWLYLFYSGNAFFDERYGIGVARARSIGGPWEKYGENPILKSDSAFDGPGHCFVMEAERGRWVAFLHARDRANPGPARQLVALPLEWSEDGWSHFSSGGP